MKEGTTLRELLKPPFSYDLVTGAIYDKNFMLCKLTVTEKHRVISGFIAAALAEKWERDFGESVRWDTDFVDNGVGNQTFYRCSKCGSEQLCKSNFCPSCGQKLLPPVEEEL